MQAPTLSNKQTSVAFILFGSTGDLSLKKVIPSLFKLYKDKLGLIPNIFCIGRREYTQGEYYSYIGKFLKKSNNTLFKKFCEKVTYINGDSTAAGTYLKINENLENKKIKKIIAYLAVPQDLHVQIVRNLHDKILANGKKDLKYVAIEKPFGHDEKSAKTLYFQLNKYIDKDKLLLIDHYLYKKAILDLGSKFKFIPAKIARIHSMSEEKDKVEHRLNFYDKIGALKDVGQNHVIQMLLVFLTKGVNTNFGKQRLCELRNLSVNQRPVFKTYLGYSGSKNTDTFFSVNLKSKNPIWKNTDIVISGGKGLERNKAGIEVTYLNGTSYFINVNAINKNINDAYYTLLENVIYKKATSVSIEEIVYSWKLCQKIINF